MSSNHPDGGAMLPQSTTPQTASPAPIVIESKGATGTGCARIGRRALLTTAAVGACAVATPFVVINGVKLSEAEVKALLQHEIGSLEGIAIDEALQIAELTRKIVQYIVVPLARFFSTISGDALGVLIGTLQHAVAVLDLVHVPTGLFAGLIGVLQGWQTNVELFPAALSAMSTGDLNGAESYLKALKTKIS